MKPFVPVRSLHLLYSPTLACNLGCRYCYLGAQTTEASLQLDGARAVDTLRRTLERLEEARVLAFNVSLHGGEVTTLPPEVLEGLFTLIRDHYRTHHDALTALGHRKFHPHLKTNLYHFEPLLPLFTRFQVSLSASLDLPLALHGRYRTTRGGGDTLPRILENLRLLAKYPHPKKVSATLCAEHLRDPSAIVADLRFLHHDIGFDMNHFNLMFAFPSGLNRARFGEEVLAPATEAQQVALHRALHEAFAGTELEEGLRRHWFDEFTPSYCTNALNCGERFFLVQGDGSVYSCVRGQGLEDLHYGNILRDPVEDILATGSRKVRELHQRFGLDEACGACAHLARCHTGCPAVKLQTGRARSYTCDLQRVMYAAQPQTYPPAPIEVQAEDRRAYVFALHPSLAFEAPAPERPKVQLPRELATDTHTLQALIQGDPVLQALYSPTAFTVELGEDLIPLQSQLLKPFPTSHVVRLGSRFRVHLPRALFAEACPEPIRNTLYLQMLRDTPVVYGDEGRTKQQHLFTYQLFADCLEPSDRLGPDHGMADLAGLLALHAPLFLDGVLNNLFFTTQYLRDYHYQKQRNNAFYHIQAMNLPFQNLEFLVLR